MEDVCATPKSDIWSFGVTLCEMVEGKTPWEMQSNKESQVGNVNPQQAILDKIGMFCGYIISRSDQESQLASLQLLLSNNSVDSSSQPSEIKNRNKENIQILLNQNRFGKVCNEIREVAKLCLEMDPNDRIDCSELLSFYYFAELLEEERLKSRKKWVRKPFLRSLHVQDLLQNSGNGNSGNYSGKNAPNEPETVSEIYHFWKLSGGNVEQALPKHLRTLPPILRLPLIVRVNGSVTYKHGVDPFSQYEESIVPVNKNHSQFFNTFD